MTREEALLSAPDRSPQDRVQDIPRRAADTIKMGALSSDHSILELEPGQGWFTDVLLRLTAEYGSLTVQQPAALDSFFGQEARQRIARSKHPRASYSNATWDKLAPQDSSIDRVVWLQGPHELWFVPASGVSFGKPATVFSEIVRVLKPGGRLLLVDNLAPAGLAINKAAALHRSSPQFLREAFEGTGLVLKEQDEQWITNNADPLTIPTYNSKVHLKTHQFLQVFYKPAS